MKLGTPVAISGRTSDTPGPASTTVARVRIPNPSRPNIPKNGVVSPPAFARRITFTNLDGTNSLLVYPGNVKNGTYITVKPNSTYTFDGTMTEFGVASSASTVQWEALAMVAA